MDERFLHDENRRRFIKTASFFALAFPASILTNRFCRAQGDQRQPVSQGVVGGGCDGCEGIYEGLPQILTWQTSIATASEPGEPLEISGIIFHSDGVTPAPGVILYVYHTDANGYYSPAPNATGNARRHGHLRGWMKTGTRGEYKFTTIKPAPYPKGKIPAHIHPIVKEPDKNEYYIDEYRFDDDPLLSAQERSKSENRGGSGIIHLMKTEEGIWRGKRNIILGLNIPNYK
ncbi:MAG: intradiol ring-cleavage dioxygenase [Blastocatellia bacterium]|nr:intradiol ring-cleavage dioxygenase [Blastocatellia bacterium]